MPHCRKKHVGYSGVLLIALLLTYANSGLASSAEDIKRNSGFAFGMLDRCMAEIQVSATQGIDSPYCEFFIGVSVSATSDIVFVGVDDDAETKEAAAHYSLLLARSVSKVLEAYDAAAPPHNRDKIKLDVVLSALLGEQLEDESEILAALVHLENTGNQCIQNIEEMHFWEGKEPGVCQEYNYQKMVFDLLASPTLIHGLKLSTAQNASYISRELKISTHVLEARAILR